jgi:23S rRNA pseudouridine955/2504/2580 synthase
MTPANRSADAPSGPHARLVTVDADHAGQRLDNFLAAHFRGVPRSRLYRSVRSGEVRVNKGRARQTYRLREGDQVRLPPLHGGTAARAGSASPAARTPAWPIPETLYGDEHLLVLNKPAGIPVHAGSGRDSGLIEMLKADPRNAQGFLELVHRLDAETSGCLLLARRRQALLGLHAQLREGSMSKRYLVLLSGVWRGGGRRVDAPLRRGINRSGERVVRIDAEGQAASTAFTPLASGGGVTLMTARPLTGRTHQIRVHAAQALRMPVVGDPRYGDRELNRRLRSAGLKRMFLHASRLVFSHPETGARVDVSAPMDDPLRGLLTYFGIADPQDSPSGCLE